MDRMQEAKQAGEASEIETTIAFDEWKAKIVDILMLLDPRLAKTMGESLDNAYQMGRFAVYKAELAKIKTLNESHDLPDQSDMTPIPEPDQPY